MKSARGPAPPPPPKGRITKRDRARYAFYVHRDDTPISIREAWNRWPEMREVRPSFGAFRAAIYRLNGSGDRHHLYAIEKGMTVVYMINMACLWYLYQRGYISREEENRARKWVSFTIQEEMEPSRVEKIIRNTKNGWNTWER